MAQCDSLHRSRNGCSRLAFRWFWRELNWPAKAQARHPKKRSGLPDQGRPCREYGASPVLFENDQLVVNPPQPWPGAGDPATDLPQACATLPPPDRARCGEAGHNWHNHKLNRVLIYFRTGGERLTYLDGTVEDLMWEPDTIKWSPPSGFHYSGPLPTPRVDPRPNGPMGVIIAIKKAGYPGKVAGTALDPLRVAPKNSRWNSRTARFGFSA